MSDHFYVNPEERSLLARKSFSLRPLANAGHLSLWQLFTMTWRPIMLFNFAFLLSICWFRLKYEAVVSAVRVVGIVLIATPPVMGFLVLSVGICTAALNSRVRWSAACYWTWWPFWNFVLCFVALSCGLLLGNYVWVRCGQVHSELARLQKYGLVDPYRVRGERMQDAGIVTFNATAGVDRARAGCFVNGATYCIAPIVRGGELAGGASSTPETGSFDFFMVGTDCCSCVGGTAAAEFRCGDWDIPAGLGGYRVLNSQDRDFYRLAVEDWGTTYGKSTRHPLFFYWKDNPLKYYNGLSDLGNTIAVLATAGSLFFFLIMAIVANAGLNVMIDNGMAAPIDPPVPASGFGRSLAKRFLPGMVNHAEEQASWQSQPTHVVL